MRFTPLAGLCLVALLAPRLAAADVTLPAVFSRGMVLQRDMPIHIFGMAQPSESVEVVLKDRTGAIVRAGRDLAEQNGAFSVTLDPLPATTNADQALRLEVTGANSVVVEDVLVGEVWIAGGQSNMEWPLAATGPQAAEAIALCGAPTIRLIKAPHVTSHRPEWNIQAQWATLTPETAPSFSAVALWFALDLREALGVPVGILSINWGGTRAEPWTDLATLGSDARYEATVAELRARVEEWNSTPEALRDRAWREAWQAFQREANGWWGAVNDGGAASAATDEPGEGWRAISMPMAWSQDAELGGWDGVTWLQRSVEIPEAWAGKACVVTYPAVDDGDVLFVNGRAVGNTLGDLSTARRYAVPGTLVKAGPMRLAIELADPHGEGGMARGPMAIACPEIEGATVALDGAWMVRKGRPASELPPMPPRPAPQAAPGTRNTDPAALYHAMIAPFAGYTVRGAIWYQGESNAGTVAEAEAYADLLPLVVRSWRSAFGRPDMPFGVVSLAAFRAFDPSAPSAGVWPVLRASQLAAEGRVPNVGVVTTIDCGDAGDIHPRDKRTVGRRLADWARATAYGEGKRAWRGPRLARHRLEGDTVVLEFDVERLPLVARGGGAFEGFAVAGADGVFHWAGVEQAGPGMLRVSSPQVPQPTVVRYGWQDNPQNANLTDSGGERALPAHPFECVVGK